MVGDELVERADPVQALRETTARQLLAVLVHQMDVAMILRPIATLNTAIDSRFGRFVLEPENPGGDLLDQYSRHDTP